MEHLLADVHSLLRNIQQLELAARFNAAGLMRGDYASAIRGQGLTFHESRKYSPGESARLIDWNITARVGEPHVRVHLDERQRDIVLVIDVSPSMALGSQEVTKLELAVELAATLAVAAIDQGDRLGLVVFADRVLLHQRPRGGRKQLFRVLQGLLQNTTPWDRPVAVSDARQAIHAIEQTRRGRYVVFLISDFIDHDLGDDLKFLRARHDVSLLRIFDPIETTADSSVRFQAVSPEGTPGLAPRGVQPGWQQQSSGPGSAEQLIRLATEQKMVCSSFSTATAIRPALDNFLHQKKRLLCR